MNRIHLALLTLGLCGLVAAAARADLFQDDFEGATGPLDAGKWTVTIEHDPEGTVTVGQDGGWAKFDFSGKGNSNQGKARTNDVWSIQDTGSLTWTIDFCVTAGTTSTVIAPFAFDTNPSDDHNSDGIVNYKDADVSVAVEFSTDPGDGWAVLNLFNVPWTSFRDSNNELFKPTMSNSYTQTLTMTLTDTEAIGVLLGTDDFGDQSEYTASVSHGLSTAVPGSFGMQVYNFNAGMNPKTIEFDNVNVIPVPVSAVLAAQGLLAVGGLEFLRRRRRAGGVAA